MMGEDSRGFADWSHGDGCSLLHNTVIYCFTMARHSPSPYLARKRVRGNCRGEALAGERPSGSRPSKCQCFTLALRFTTCSHGLARGPLAFGLAREDVGMCIPGPLAFENGQLGRWKPFGLARKWALPAHRQPRRQGPLSRGPQEPASCWRSGTYWRAASLAAEQLELPSG